jgi:hypothetical protein
MSEPTSTTPLPATAVDAGLLQPQRIRTLGLDTPSLAPAERERLGRARRDVVPRASIGDWTPPADRLDPVARLMAGNAGRDPALVPLRMSRMAVSPFTFLRGSASVMAADLATLPTSGLDVMLDGDAHMNNFGIFGTPDAQVVVAVEKTVGHAGDVVGHAPPHAELLDAAAKAGRHFVGVEAIPVE